MKAGMTFVLARDHQAIDNHLWIVLSDTDRFPESIVIVSVTTNTAEKDQACVIERHEHPWLRRRSCISYVHAKVVTLTVLGECKDKGSILLQEPLSVDLLERVRDRSGDSTTLPTDIADILIEQGIVRLDD